MSTTAQIEANRENAQHSSGPKTEAGKAIAAQNNHRHGLAGGIFDVLPWEEQQDYNDLLVSLFIQHDPQTPFEETLVQKIAQHFWLSQRALRLQELCFDREVPHSDSPKGLQLYMRYQATHDRSYHKLSDELRKLRNEARKTQIGFESQKAKEATETRRQTAEFRKQAEETRRAAAEIRREANESRRSELHSKRLALLDAQVKRLSTPAPAPLTSRAVTDTHFVSQNTHERGAQAA